MFFFLLWFNIDIGIVKFIELILKTLFCLYQDSPDALDNY